VTLLPATAEVNLDFRLVADQDPSDIVEKVRRHLRSHGFEDIEVIAGSGVEPSRTSPDTPFARLVTEAARQVYGVEPRVIPTGDSTTVAAVPGLWCYLLARLDPQFLAAVTPPGLREQLGRGELWVYRINPVKPAASSFIMTNNISVSFTLFALGIVFGAGTLWALVSNGIHFGTIAAVVGQTRMSRELWAFVAPHGALEIPAIIIAGAAGLILGGALLFPGDLRRRDALVARGRVAVALVLGCVPILVMAGIIEAFFSPLPPASIPPSIKLITGGSLFTLFLLYVLRAGTRAPEPECPGAKTARER
jgi:uncharacterized membrane protein SpoIIM required for sporulation